MFKKITLPAWALVLMMLVFVPLSIWANTQYRKVALFNSTIDSSTLGATAPSSVAGTTLKVNTGLTSGPGIQYLQSITCTASGAGGFCSGGPGNTALSWPVPFADNNYIVLCALESTATLYYVSAGGSHTATAINPIIQLTAGNTAPATGVIDCVGIHKN